MPPVLPDMTEVPLPEVPQQFLTVSTLTLMPLAASNSSMSRQLSVNLYKATQRDRLFGWDSDIRHKYWYFLCPD